MNDFGVLRRTLLAALALVALVLCYPTSAAAAACLAAGETDPSAVVVACTDRLAETASPAEKATLLIEKSKAHRRLGELDAAHASADEATRLVPGSANAWIEMGYVRHALGDLEGALAAHSRARDAEPDNWRAVLVRLDALADVERYAECLEETVRAVELAPDRAHTYAFRGRCLAGLERYEEAVVDYERAVGMGLAEAFLYSNLALALLESAGNEPALAAAQRAVELDPTSEFGQLALVDALMALDRNDEAIQAYQAAHVAGLPDTLGRANALAWELYLDGDYAAAEEIMSGYFAADPELGAEQAYEADTFAHILAAQDQPERAVEMFLLAAELSQEHASGYRLRLDRLGIGVGQTSRDLEQDLRACVATGAACRLSD